MSSGRCNSGITTARICKGHELDEPQRNVLLLGQLYEVGDFSVVEVLDDDSIQFDRLEVRR